MRRVLTIRHSFIHLFNKYLLNFYYVPGHIDAKNTRISKTIILDLITFIAKWRDRYLLHFQTNKCIIRNEGKCSKGKETVT